MKFLQHALRTHQRLITCTAFQNSQPRPCYTVISKANFSMTSADKITLYTNRLCPFAHRTHIALAELKLDYEEVIIDLSKPREPWYLEVNPVRLNYIACLLRWMRNANSAG